MGVPQTTKKIVPLLKSSISILVENKVIFYPFCCTAFVQLLALEVLFFSHRHPLNTFFGPIIAKLWSENYLHYPYNFILLPKLFQYAQYPIYIFISSFFIGSAIFIIKNINNNQHIRIKDIFKETRASYLHIVVAASISLFFVIAFFKFYGVLIERAIVIRSVAGKFYYLKRLILDGAPYINFVFSVFITTVFAYVIPIIVIEKKKVFEALLMNFQTLWKSFWFTFSIIFLPSSFYIPVMLMRNIFAVRSLVPELSVLNLILSIFVTLVIDAVVYTSLTAYYLMKKEHS